jgi:hypothetical protein
MCRVLDVLKNPRYAGLSASKGRVLGRGQWPAYISERQHYKLKARFAAARPARTPRKREPYLLSRLDRCGYCGTGMHCHTGQQRVDGSFIRSYCCWSHYRGSASRRCPAPRIDADIAEAMFASTIHSFLLHGEQPEQTMRPNDPLAFEGHWSGSPERQRVLEALLAGDDAAIDAGLEALLARMAPEASALRQIATSGRLTREFELACRIQRWAAQERTGRTDESRSETRELNRLLRECFSAVSVAMDQQGVTIVAYRQTNGVPLPVEVRFDRRDYARYVPEHRRGRVHRTWGESEMIDALRAWADEHGRSPKLTDWFFSDPERPTSHTVRRRYGSWAKALKRAGLKPAARESTWERSDIARALRTWTEQHGRRPKSVEWRRGEQTHPSDATVRAHFGTWHRALAAAGVLKIERSHHRP